MKAFCKANSSYFIGILVLTCLGLYGLTIAEKGIFLVELAEHRTENRDVFFRIITLLSEGYSYFPIFLIALWWRYSYAVGVAAAGGLSMVVSAILKFFFQHERPKTYFDEVIHKPHLVSYVPDVELHTGWTTSFPSGHTISAFALYGLLAFYSKSSYWKLFFLSIASLIGFSRMYLFQHFLKDVLAGMWVGTCLALLVYEIQQFIKLRYAPLAVRK